MSLNGICWRAKTWFHSAVLTPHCFIFATRNLFLDVPLSDEVQKACKGDKKSVTLILIEPKGFHRHLSHTPTCECCPHKYHNLTRQKGLCDRQYNQSCKKTPVHVQQRKQFDGWDQSQTSLRNFSEIQKFSSAHNSRDIYCCEWSEILQTHTPISFGSLCDG